MVTNGYRVWQRNIPIGGNHFTRALSKELKLTFVKAEHLKRNATQADDPKAVFQAMRPVFSDLLAEIQRSLGYFSSIDKAAKISSVIALGNAMKLPGLQRYLSQNLEHEVTPVEEFAHLSAGSNTSQTQFHQNILSFAVSYGLCLQGLGKSEIHTNLLPEEIVRTRLIRAKKPWAVAGVAALLMGMTFNYAMHVSAWRDTATDDMGKAEKAVSAVQAFSTGFKSTSTEIHTAFDTIEQTGKNLVSNVEGRLLWLELTKAIEAALPKDERPLEEREETVEDISDRNELHIEAIDEEYFTDLEGQWFSLVEASYKDSRGLGSGAEAGDEAGSDATEELDSVDEGESAGIGEEGEEGDGAPGDLNGAGWVVQLTGYHYHNHDKRNQTVRFVNNTLIKNLEEGFVELPDGPNGELIKVSFADLGISHPWLVKGNQTRDEMIDLEAGLGPQSSSGGGFEGEYGGFGGGGGLGRPPGSAEVEEESSIITLRRYEFIVQFCWKETPRSKRKEIAETRRQAEAARADAAALEGQEDLETF